MSEPQEILAPPVTLWVAPVGTVFPELDETPGGSWTKVGTSGDLNVTEDGVTVTHGQSIETFKALGSTGARKAFRTDEEQRISLAIADLTLEQYALALNGNTVTTVAAGVGTPGYKKVGLSRGRTVQQRALLMRSSESPYGEDWTAQYEVPVAVQVSEPELVFQKGEPVAIALEWLTLEDPDAASDDERFGRFVAQNADAGT